jgi:hypothetical protein
LKFESIIIASLLTHNNAGPETAPFNVFGPPTKLLPLPFKIVPVASEKYLDGVKYGRPVLGEDGSGLITVQHFEEQLVCYIFSALLSSVIFFISFSVY